MDFAVSATPRMVEAWSTARLPFEPQGWRLTFRTALREAIKGLVGTDGTLYACYTSADLHPCDVENVLLYNLGLSAFSHLAPTEVVVERRYDVPQVAEATDGPARHYYRYEVGAVGRRPDWATVASWTTVALAPPFSIERVWAGLQPAVVVGTPPAPGAPLAVDLRLERPAAVKQPSVLAMTKSVVDGAIAALHAHDGSQLAMVAARLANRVQSTPALIAARLTDPSRAVLGVRRLLWPFRDFVQWNPADDRITHLRLSAHTGEDWRLSGTITVPEAA